MFELNEICYKHIIKKISLKVQPGKITGIIGPNGSGKSTLLKILNGIWPPCHGTVTCQTKDVLSLPRKELSRLVTLVPQLPQLNFDYTVRELVEMGFYAAGSRLYKEQLLWALEAADITHISHRPVTQISGGERQRAYIARALATGAPILLLDEPTSNLDIQHQLAIWQLLAQFAEQGKTVIVTLHDLLAAERFCDQIAILSEGCCLGHGPFHTTLNAELLQQVFGVVRQGQHFTVPE